MHFSESKSRKDDFLLQFDKVVTMCNHSAANIEDLNFSQSKIAALKINVLVVVWLKYNI